MDITYDISNPRALNLGHQYDHNVSTVTFTGFTPVDDSNTVYLKFEGLGLYPLSDMAFPVSQSFTLRDGLFKGQLFELASDGTLVQNSDIFKMLIKPSINEEDEIVAEDASISLWFDEMSDLYNKVLEVYEDGLMVTSENIIAALGYTPADSADIPTKLSDLENDTGYMSEITAEDISDALGYTPASETQIPTKMSELENDYDFISEITADDINNALGYTAASVDDIPTKVSELTNDSGYISGITSENVTEALGYTPISSNDLEDFLTDITAEDIISSLGYTPADVDDIPVVPSNVSEFTNDAGYISEITADDIVEALGYTPADESFGNYELINSVTISSASSSLVISQDSDGNAFGMDGIAVIMKNSNGIQGGSNGYMYAYDADDNVIGGMPVFFYGGTSVTQSAIIVEIRGSIVEMKSIGWTSTAPYSPVNKTLVGEISSTGRIAKVEIIGNGQTLRTGTEFNLYGYKSDGDDSSGTVVSTGEFEVIKEISLMSAAQSVVVSTDLSSNYFDLSGIAIVIKNENGMQGGTNGYINIYNSDGDVMGDSQIFFASSSSITTSVVKIELEGEIMDIVSVGWNDRSAYSPTNKSIIQEKGVTGSIRYVEIIGNGYELPAGTTITVYGVKA